MQPTSPFRPDAKHRAYTQEGKPSKMTDPGRTSDTRQAGRATAQAGGRIGFHGPGAHLGPPGPQLQHHQRAPLRGSARGNGLAPDTARAAERDAQPLALEQVDRLFDPHADHLGHGSGRLPGEGRQFHSGRIGFRKALPLHAPFRCIGHVEPARHTAHLVGPAAFERRNSVRLIAPLRQRRLPRRVAGVNAVGNRTEHRPGQRCAVIGAAAARARCRS